MTQSDQTDGALAPSLISSETHVRQVFGLTQGKPPLKKQLAEKVGRPALETLENSLRSRFFAETVLVKFLSGDDHHKDLGLTEAVVRREANRLRDRSARPVEPPLVADDALLTWRYAFFRFWSEIGDVRGDLLKGISHRSDASRRNVARFAEALAELDRVDRMTASGDVTSAVLAARRGVERGLTCFTTRYLALSYHLCAEPAQLENMLREQEAVCSEHFARAIRNAQTSMFDAHGEKTVDEMPDLMGELPQAYLALETPVSDRFSSRAAARWSVLTRPDLRKSPRTASTEPRVIMQASGASAAEIAAAARNCAAAGARVTLVDPPDGRVRHLFTEGENVDFAADFMEARRTIAHNGPLLALARFAVPHPEIFSLLNQFEGADGLFPITVEFMPETQDLPQRQALFGRESVLAGVYSSDASLALDALARNENRPDIAAAVAAEITPPSSLYVSKAYASSDAELEQDGVVLSFGIKRPPATESQESHLRHLGLEAGETGAAAAKALRKLRDEAQLPEDTPVVFLADGFVYEPGYVRQQMHRYEIYSRRLPIATRGVGIRRSDGACELTDASRDNGLQRAAPLGLCCLGLGTTIAALEAWGDRPASHGVAIFSPAAAAWDEGFGLVRGPWGEFLRKLARDAAAAQAIFDAGRVSLSTAITRLGSVDDTLGIVPLQAYLHGQEAARRHMADAARIADPGPAVAALLESGAVESLLNDGEGAEVCRFLEALAPRIEHLQGMDVGSFRRLLDLVVQCGMQKPWADALAPLAPNLCAQHPQKIYPIFRIISNSLDDTITYAALFATLEPIVRTMRQRHVTRVAVLISELCRDDMLSFALRLLDAALGPELRDLPGIQRGFGKRLMFSGERDIRLVHSGLSISDLLASVSVRDRLFQALISRDRASAVAAMREFTDREGRVSGLLEVLRGMSGEAAELGITAKDWFYPAYAGPEETLTIAAILGDRDTIATGLVRVESPTIRVVAQCALGNFTEMDALYADWAAEDGVAPLAFSGTSVRELYRGLVEVPRSAIPTEVPDSDTPLISTIVTTFDADPDLLRSALLSVLRQEWSNLEILLVDDGSAPALREAARDLSGMDDRIRFIEQSFNAGPYVARNRALEEARGAYIAIQDADDFSHSGRFARQAAVLRDHPDVLATASKHIRFDEWARPQLQKNMRLLSDGTMTTMFRREVFERLGPFVQTRSRGDVEYRERIRQAFGPAAFRETQCPLVIAYGAPMTLSNSIAREKAHFLKEFRNDLSRRRWRWTANGPEPLGQLPVPMALRP